MEYPRRVVVSEVGPLDGFRIEEAFIPTDRKIAMVDTAHRRKW